MTAVDIHEEGTETTKIIRFRFGNHWNVCSGDAPITEEKLEYFRIDDHVKYITPTVEYLTVYDNCSFKQNNEKKQLKRVQFIFWFSNIYRVNDSTSVYVVKIINK